MRTSSTAPRSAGRPKGTPNTRTILANLLNETVVCNRTGAQHTALEWVVLRLKMKAASGDIAAINLKQKYFGALEDPVESIDTTHGGCLLVPDIPSMEQWIEEANQDNLRKDRARQEIMAMKRA